MGQYEDQLVVLDHHVSDGLANSFSEGRATFYGVQYIPHVFIDGKYDHIGASSCAGAANTYRGSIEARLAETGGVSPVEITGGHYFEGSTLHVEANFELVDPTSLGTVRAYVAIGENDVAAAGGPYDHITRAGALQSMMLVDLGDTGTLSTQFTVPGTWDPAELYCLAWIQKTTGDKEVYQAANLPLGDPMDVSAEPFLSQESGILSVGPNPMPAFVEGPAAASVRFALSNSAAERPIQLNLIDVNGRLIREIYHGQVSAGTNTLTWDGRDEEGRPLESGAYWVLMNTAAGTSNARVVVIN